MEYTKELLKQIVQVGTLGYPLSKIINVLDIVDPYGFARDFNDPDSVIAKNYQKGVDKADFIMDSKLFEMAKNGDLKAMEKYEARKRVYLQRSEMEKSGKK